MNEKEITAVLELSKHNIKAMNDLDCNLNVWMHISISVFCTTVRARLDNAIPDKDLRDQAVKRTLTYVEDTLNKETGDKQADLE